MRTLWTLLFVPWCVASASVAADQLPDLTIDTAWLHDNDVSWGVQPGCAHLRLSAAMPNVGSGPLELHGRLPPNPDGTQDVYQRIFRGSGNFWRFAGAFVYHDEHSHVHFEDWAVYRLREDLGDSPGDTLVEGDKISFCLLDSSPYDLGLPGAPSSRVYSSCGAEVQGISVGWEDVYRKHLEGQSIPLCGISNGSYWVEAEIDPLDRILEVDEMNNVDAALVSIEIPPPPACNDGNDNDGDLAVDFGADPGCTDLTDPTEAAASCGLGPELIALSPVLAAWRRRRERRTRSPRVP